MEKNTNKQILLNFVTFIVWPLLINIVIESFGNKNVFGGITKLFTDPYIFISNTFIIATTLSVGLFIGKFRYFWVSVVSSCWILLGLINYILITNRVLPLTAYDVQLLDALPFIIRKYLTPYPLAAVCLLVVMLLLGFFVLFFRALASPKVRYSVKLSTAFFVVIVFSTLGLLKYGIASNTLETHFAELAKAYSDNGFAYSFLTGLVDSGVDKVEGYGEELIDSISSKFVATVPEKVKKPNIIFVQMESFFDLRAIDSVKFSENPAPNFTKLMEQYPSGLLTVPVVGAGTVNTEFEVITGMKVSDFGAGEYPYKTILADTTCESIANNTKNYGYTSHFIHNYKGSFYGRNKVYANLGYDYFYSLEYMTDYEVNENGWARDTILLRYINECLDSTPESDFITAVSVQGHGSYEDKTNYTKHLTVTECNNKSMHSSFEYYANQVYEMDQFIGMLVESLSKREEETILVIYGDHFPSIGLDDNQLNGRKIYQTDYIIWNNLGIEYEDEDIAAYQLGSKILESINICDGTINSCHQQYRDSDKYLYNLKALEYDILYGERFVYNGANPYDVSDMKVNRRKMMVHSVVPKENAKNTYIVTGEGFSENTFVRTGFKLNPITYIDENTMEFYSVTINPGVHISVWEKDIGDSDIYIMK